MKRVISLLLCLVMCISFFSATATQVYALGKTDDIFTIEKTEFKNDKKLLALEKLLIKNGFSTELTDKILYKNAEKFFIENL